MHDRNKNNYTPDKGQRIGLKLTYDNSIKWDSNTHTHIYIWYRSNLNT